MTGPAIAQWRFRWGLSRRQLAECCFMKEGRLKAIETGNGNFDTAGARLIAGTIKQLTNDFLAELGVFAIEPGDNAAEAPAAAARVLRRRAERPPTDSGGILTAPGGKAQS